MSGIRQVVLVIVKAPQLRESFGIAPAEPLDLAGGRLGRAGV